ncbi:uncharacterized protein [Cicer arietinum]|uniref:uncharacterized protein isoform X5 n=1 Tax=Cicer arietinum TaxID=3827 RepID=UPI003CC644A2
MLSNKINPSDCLDFTVVASSNLRYLVYHSSTAHIHILASSNLCYLVYHSSTAHIHILDKWILMMIALVKMRKMSLLIVMKMKLSVWRLFA